MEQETLRKAFISNRFQGWTRKDVINFQKDFQQMVNDHKNR